MAAEQSENTNLVDRLINDFETQIAALQAAVTSLRAVRATGAMGAVAGGSAISATVQGSAAVVDLPEGAFRNKSIPACIELYLSTVGMKKKTNKEIAEALREGGVESNADNFDNLVAGALFKLKKVEKVLRFKDGWGLAANYPAHIRAAASANHSKTTKHSKTKKRNKAKGATAAKQPKVSAEAVTAPPPAPRPAVEKKKGWITEEIATLLERHPGRAFDAAEFAERFGLNVQVAHMIASKLARAGGAHKTEDGKYQHAA